MFWQRFEELCKRNGSKPNPVATSLGISSGAVTKWKQTGITPNGKTLNAIADYFGVSVDYLIGKTDIPNKKEKPTAISDELWNKIENDPKALKLLELLLNMSPEQRDKFERLLEDI